MFHVFAGKKTLISPVVRPLESLIYKIGGVREDEEMPWTTYTFALLLFSVVTLVITYAVLRFQAFLPWYDKSVLTTTMTPDLAFNTAISFTTNTNWQAYSGENTMSYFFADCRAGVAQLLFGGGRHCDCDCAGAGSGAALGGFHRQFLGGFDPRDPVCPSAAVPGVCAGAVSAGRD